MAEAQPALAGAAEVSPRLVSVKEYAAMKGVTPETVRRWIRAGLIPRHLIDRAGDRGHIRIKITSAA